MHTLFAPVVVALALARPSWIPPAPEPPPDSAPDRLAAPTPEAKPFQLADPFAEEVDDGKFELGGFIKRPPPPPPVEAGPPPVEETMLVWGLHQPVARWKRTGLIASGVLTGVALVSTGATWASAQHQLNRIHLRIDGLQDSGVQISSNAPQACRQNVDYGQVVNDVGLAYACQSFELRRKAMGLSIGFSVVGALAMGTFAILHAVRRVPVRRVEARADGVAVRF